MKEIWNSSFFGNTTLVWLTCLGILIASFIAIAIFKKIVLIRLRKWSAKTVNTFDDFIITIVEKSVVPLMYLVAVNFVIKILVLPATLIKILDVAFMFVVTYFILQIISAMIKNFVFSFLEKQENSETKEKQVKGMLIIINVVIWLLGILFLMSNLGYNVTTIITGLGIGGIAIALAAQTILGDLFSYFIIFFDQPFEIGDFIIVEEKMGVIEYVGIKTTRIRTLSGEQLICSNTYLTSTPVHNYKRMEQRRIVFNIGVVYQTPHEQLKQIPELVNDIIRSKSDVRFDRGHFSGFGDSSLDFEFVFYVESREYNFYMDRQQEIYLDIFAAFAARGIEFAYPTRTLFVNHSSPAEEGAGNEQPTLDNGL